ncbi:hypothetical protein EVAR_13915_1 [Eumeta japonica]|uniref:Uncharacterized protein n=1 Tax=Eumeta variegata TaxID=151549 RepID=A0A4C1U8D2_EUMVA|nr:hypothetical protein EVAR_13915_1 [Eumeta japonica]
MGKGEKKPIMGRPRARAHRVQAIVSAHQWPSVIAVWCLENYYRVRTVQYHPRTTTTFDGRGISLTYAEYSRGDRVEP